MKTPIAYETALRPRRNSAASRRRFACGKSVLLVALLALSIIATAGAGDSQAKVSATRDPLKDFYIDLPTALRPFPEPLAPGQEPGFKIRGIKGWNWTLDQYLPEIPILAQYKLNFLMNCYTSLYDRELYRAGNPGANRWWEDWSAETVAALEKIVRACQKHGVVFCFSVNPNNCSRRVVRYDSAEDRDLIWKHFSLMQGLGVRWFNLSLDDISQGLDPAGQARFVNDLLRRLRARDPSAQMVFCPTYYAGVGTGPEARPYLETLGRELDPEIYVFWTGDSLRACSDRITREGAATFKGIIKHRVIVWDNYPVNDWAPALHLGPLVGRDPDLCEVADGIMSNPHRLTIEINRLPTLTLADYAYNPRAYDPVRSIGQAILHLADTDEQRLVLRDLVEANPGRLFYGQCSCAYNSMQERFRLLASAPHSRPIVRLYLKDIKELLARLDRAFPDRYGAEKTVLKENIAWMEQAFAAKYKVS